MENKSYALRAGLFTLGLLVAAVIVALWFTRQNSGRLPYEMATRLPITGLNPQAAVRYRGLDVGKVDSMDFDPKVPGQILLKMSIDPGTPITRSTFGTLAYQGVTGIAYVQLDDDGSDPTPVRSTPEQVVRIEMRPSILDTLQLRGLAILNQTEEVAKRLNSLLSEENRETIIGAVKDVSIAAREVAAVPRQLQPTLDKLPALTQQAQTTIHSFNQLARSADRLTTRLGAPDGPIDRLSLTIDQIGMVADRVGQEAVPLMQEANGTLRTLNRTLESVGERPQSILFGASRTPGPGEDGFSAPAK
jgi:phospholipid/cholesterol/gamma-HCH transport system substrate-binding protein